MKKTKKRVVSKSVKPVKKAHILRRHIAVTSPLGMLLAGAFVVAATSVAYAGYKAIVKSPDINKIGFYPGEPGSGQKIQSITGRLSKETVTENVPAADPRGTAKRVSTVKYYVTDSRGAKIELVGISESMRKFYERQEQDSWAKTSMQRGGGYAVAPSTDKSKVETKVKELLASMVGKDVVVTGKYISTAQNDKTKPVQTNKKGDYMPEGFPDKLAKFNVSSISLVNTVTTKRVEDTSRDSNKGGGDEVKTTTSPKRDY